MLVMDFKEEYTAKITTKGQVTIPIQIRNKLELDAGDRISFKINEHDEIFLVKKHDDLIERVILTTTLMKKNYDLILVEGSTTENRLQFIDDLLSEHEYDIKYLWSDEKIQLATIDSFNDLYYPTLDDFVENYTDNEHDETKMILIYEMQVDFDVLFNLKAKGFDIILLFEKANFENIFTWDPEWFDYPENIRDRLSFLYLELNTNGDHVLKYCVNQTGQMIKEKIIIG
ncbi:AbrB/MazE/SpoVT family DNA-binding domain-containing protein [Lysinibacillus boronitolerans]|uniref:AbrB/MazE/SpoVT family DNA-binding domain-containing protein n=2 Tax=Lysinibacillus TaxID=400634 RepID=UPI0003049D49